MARLSAQEKAMLERLTAKQDAPDAPAVGRSVNVTINLGDEKQVARAIKMGLLDDDSDPVDDGNNEDNQAEDDDAPKRRGYFS